ncbi:hypothetical protein C8F04DRAFT_1107146 [Mycena alexandri]|uniref:Uncharacterized protein n=1 Tax=Mycena alexandri TaxID=1745969 RepID=A0AAD6X0X7_9AGAR|nr:hypothetical protein C8F04DRAFT_1107146 [Mycena alexandri]
MTSSATLPTVLNIQRVYRIALDQQTSAPQTIDISLDLIVSSEGEVHLDVRSLGELSRVTEVGAAGQASPPIPRTLSNVAASSVPQASSSHTPLGTPTALPSLVIIPVPVVSSSRATPNTTQNDSNDDPLPEYSRFPPPPDTPSSPDPPRRALAPIPRRQRAPPVAFLRPNVHSELPAPDQEPSTHELYEATQRGVPSPPSSADSEEDYCITDPPRRKRYIEHWENVKDYEDENVEVIRYAKRRRTSGPLGFLFSWVG